MSKGNRCFAQSIGLQIHSVLHFFDYFQPGHNWILGFVLFLALASWATFEERRRERRRMAKKLDGLLGQGLPSGVSSEVWLLAQDPGQKIAAIKLHRDRHPDMSIAEAKRQVEACATEK